MIIIYSDKIKMKNKLKIPIVLRRQKYEIAEIFSPLWSCFKKKM